MVRRVKAYLKTMKVITNEEELHKMSQECEPPLGGLPPPPPPITMVSTVLERMLSSASPEAEIWDEIQTKVFRVFLLSSASPEVEF
jgi:hypothetical protein